MYEIKFFCIYLYKKLKIAILIEFQFFFQPDKHKGISHLIDIENPNRVKQKSKKVSDIELNQKPTLSRRERFPFYYLIVGKFDLN